MTRRNARRLGVWIAIASAAPASAAPPAAPDAAALVRSVREQEAWIDRVDSFWLKALITWEETPRGIARRRREAVDAGPVQFTLDLSRSQIQRSEVAFDRTRIRKSDQSPWGTDDLRVWD